MPLSFFILHSIVICHKRYGLEFKKRKRSSDTEKRKDNIEFNGETVIIKDFWKNNDIKEIGWKLVSLNTIKRLLIGCLALLGLTIAENEILR